MDPRRYQQEARMLWRGGRLPDGCGGIRCWGPGTEARTTSRKENPRPEEGRGGGQNNNGDRQPEGTSAPCTGVGLVSFGIDHGWILSEMLPAVHLKKSRWRQSQAGGFTKQRGGTIGENVFVHKASSRVGAWSQQTCLQVQARFRFDLDFHGDYSRTVTKVAGGVGLAPLKPRLNWRRHSKAS